MAKSFIMSVLRQLLLIRGTDLFSQMEDEVFDSMELVHHFKETPKNEYIFFEAHLHKSDVSLCMYKGSFLTPIGQGDENVLVWTPGLPYDYFSKNKLNLQARVTPNYANGNLGTAFGPGDIYLSAFKSKLLKGNWNLTSTLGVKIPLSPSNISEAGMPLPMQYQSSLGTFDVIAGLTFSDKQWQFSVGYQHPLSGENKNGFLPESLQWPRFKSVSE